MARTTDTGERVTPADLDRDDGPEAVPVEPAPAGRDGEPATAGSATTPPQPAERAEGERAEEEEAAPGDPDAGASAAGPPVLVRGLALGAALLFLVTAVVTGVVWNTDRIAEAERSAVLEAARQAAVNLTSINFETAEADVRRVLDGATGDFGGLFEQNIDSYVGLVQQSEVVTSGEVTGIGLQEFDDDSALVVVAVRTGVSNASVPDGESRFYRMVTEMQKEDDRWLVSRVEFVP